MSEQTAVAAPSAAQESTTTTIEIPRSGTTEYAEWRVSGSLPEKQAPKPADSASADTSKETKTDDAADSAAQKTQEHGKRRADGGEDRFQKLTRESKARIAELERELAEARKPKSTQADPSSARQTEPAQPPDYQQWRKAFKPTEWVNQYIKDHPNESYEDANAAMADHLSDVRDRFRQAEQARDAATRSFADSVSQARKSYPDFDTVAEPMAKQVNDLIIDPKVDGTLKKVLFDSDAVHILYALGSDPALAESFGNLARTDPAEAIYLWKSLKAAVKKELSGSSETTSKTPGRDEKGQFTAKAEEPPAPAKRGPESAAPPPLEIGHRGPGVGDESERALKAAERGDPNAFGAWKRAEDAKELRRRRGA